MCAAKFLHYDLKLDNLFAVTDNTGGLTGLRVFDFEFCKHGKDLTDDDYLEFLHSTLTGCVHELILMRLSGGADSFRDLYTKLKTIVAEYLTTGGKEKATEMITQFESSVASRVSTLPSINPSVQVSTPVS